MATDILEQVKSDMEFLLTFTPAKDPREVERGLSPMFYVTGTYEGDIELAQRVKDIRDRYDIQDALLEDEDYEEVG